MPLSTARLTVRVVLPLPLLAFVKVIVSPYPPVARLFAAALIVAVTVVLAPAASAPPVPESVSQPAVLPAVQFIVPVPVFESVYVPLTGEKEPPVTPPDASPAVGVTESTGAGVTTV